MAQSRTKNVFLNMIVALVCQIINLILSFFSRSVFVKVLGLNYLGVNGLFTNVLTILSFAELGIGSAIIFSLYKPLATGDQEKISSLMQLYKRAYQIIGVVITIIGLSCIPFLNFIIKESPNTSEKIELLYILFLTNTIVSYFFVYKKSIIIADQKNYIVIVLTEGIHLFQIVTQIIFLYFTYSYIVFLIIQIACTFLGNIIACILANRIYPFLKKPSKTLPKAEKQEIFKNVRSLAAYKFGSVILNGTDNILVSSLVGVTSVGLVSNYVLLNTACNSILGKVAEAFTASVGNLNAVADSKKQYDIFNRIFFITAWLYGLASVGLITVGEQFICAWLGKEYLIDTMTAITIVVGFYVQGVHFAAYTYRTTLGLFKQGQLTPILAAILNIILSIVLFKWLGLAGIFIATPISRLLTTGIVDPILIYKEKFMINPIVYYVRYILYFLIFALITILLKYILSLFFMSGWLGVIVQMIIVIVIFNIIMILLFAPTKMFRETFHDFIFIFRKNKKGGNNCI